MHSLVAHQSQSFREQCSQGTECRDREQGIPKTVGEEYYWTSKCVAIDDRSVIPFLLDEHAYQRLPSSHRGIRITATASKRCASFEMPGSATCTPGMERAN